jgi:hypothetical protein
MYGLAMQATAAAAGAIADRPAAQELFDEVRAGIGQGAEVGAGNPASRSGYGSYS